MPRFLGVEIAEADYPQTVIHEPNGRVSRAWVLTGTDAEIEAAADWWLQQAQEDHAGRPDEPDCMQWRPTMGGHYQKHVNARFWSEMCRQRRTEQ